MDASLADNLSAIISAIGGETEAKKVGCDALVAKPFDVPEALQTSASLVSLQSSTN